MIDVTCLIERVISLLNITAIKIAEPFSFIHNEIWTYFKIKGMERLKFLLVASTVIVPAIMLFLSSKSDKLQLIFNIIAVLSIIIFGSITSTSIYQIILDDEVFMTTIHAIFLNPAFLITGGYLGAFVIYRLMMLSGMHLLMVFWRTLR